MGSGCVGSSNEVVDSKKVNLVELPAKIQRSTVLNDGGERLKACVRVREEGVEGEATCHAMELVGTKAKLTIANLKKNTNYVVTIEFSFDSETYGKVMLATVEKVTTTVAGNNRLSFGSDLYQYPDDDKDGWDNHKELERDTDPYVVDKMTRTSLLEVGHMDCTHGGTLVETGIDKNANEVLDDNEVDARESICKDPPVNTNGRVGWQGATLVENSNVGDAWKAQVAVDGSGNAVAVWEEHDGTHYNIWSNRFDPLAGWSTATLVETNDSGSAVSPQVVLDGDGNALVVWQQSDGVRENIWARRFVSDTGWSAATLIETNDAGDAVSPQMAIDSSGNVVAVWRQSDGELENIWASRFDVDTGWEAATLIEADNVGDAWVPQVAMDRSGHAVAVWVQWWEGALKVWANHYLPGTGWGTAELIDSADSERSDFPQVAVDGRGNAIVVWQKNDGARDSVWSNRFVSGAGWEGARLIEAYDNGSVWNAQVAMDRDGNAVVVWQQHDGLRKNIGANRFVKDVGWGTAELIETENLGDARDPQVALDLNGNAVAVWLQGDGVRNNIWANRFVKESGWGTAELIETDNTGSAWGPQVAVDSNGNAVAVWSQLRGGNTFFDIWGNRFQAE